MFYLFDIIFSSKLITQVNPITKPYYFFTHTPSIVHFRLNNAHFSGPGTGSLRVVLIITSPWWGAMVILYHKAA